MSKVLTYAVLAVSILSFFCLMSRIDFIVHSILYGYGLEFSYEWANAYWATYSGSFVVFSVTIGSTYWLASNRDASDKRFSLTIIATVNVLMIGGVQDIMFFVFWSGGLPPDNVSWWWVPWTYLFGTWNSFMQVITAAMSVLITAALWIQLVGKNTNNTKYLAEILADNSQMLAEDNDHKPSE